MAQCGLPLLGHQAAGPWCPVTWRKVVKSGEVIPWGYGISWYEFASDRAVCHPLGVNVLMAALSRVLVWVRFAGVGPSRTAYLYGKQAGFREGDALGRREGMERGYREGWDAGAIATDRRWMSYKLRPAGIPYARET